MRLLMATILCILALTATAGPAHAHLTSPHPITGSSTAACTPAPCGPGEITRHMLAAVPNDDGTVSSRTYAVYRPANLLASPANVAPAYLVFNSSGSCGYSNAGQWQRLAAANRFIVVNMEVPCGRQPNTDSWGKKWVEAPGLSTPDDEPYVRAVVADLSRCPGECADPLRMYAVGQSSGGGMVADIMCDPVSSPLFRAYHIDSSSLQAFTRGPNCPSTNRNFFVMLALSNYGADRGIFYDTLAARHLDVNQSGVHFQDWVARRLDCTGRQAFDRVGVQQTLNGAPDAPAMSLRYRELAPCAFATGGVGVESLAILNGGHGWQCQDSAPQSFGCPDMTDPPGLDPFGAPWTDGLSVEQQFIDFVDAGQSG